MPAFNLNYDSEQLLELYVTVCIKIALVLDAVHNNYKAEKVINFDFRIAHDELQKLSRSYSAKKQHSQWQQLLIDYYSIVVETLALSTQSPAASSALQAIELHQEYQCLSKSPAFLEASEKILSHCVLILSLIKATRVSWLQNLQIIITGFNNTLAAINAQIEDSDKSRHQIIIENSKGNKYFVSGYSSCVASQASASASMVAPQTVAQAKNAREIKDKTLKKLVIEQSETEIEAIREACKDKVKHQTLMDAYADGVAMVHERIRKNQFSIGSLTFLLARLDEECAVQGTIILDEKFFMTLQSATKSISVIRQLYEDASYLTTGACQQLLNNIKQRLFDIKTVLDEHMKAATFSNAKSFQQKFTQLFEVAESPICVLLKKMQSSSTQSSDSAKLGYLKKLAEDIEYYYSATTFSGPYKMHTWLNLQELFRHFRTSLVLHLQNFNDALLTQLIDKFVEKYTSHLEKEIFAREPAFQKYFINYLVINLKVELQEKFKEYYFSTKLTLTQPKRPWEELNISQDYFNEVVQQSLVTSKQESEKFYQKLKNLLLTLPQLKQHIQTLENFKIKHSYPITEQQHKENYEHMRLVCEAVKYAFLQTVAPEQIKAYPTLRQDPTLTPLVHDIIKTIIPDKDSGIMKVLISCFKGEEKATELAFTSLFIEVAKEVASAIASLGELAKHYLPLIGPDKHQPSEPPKFNKSAADLDSDTD
jgi:hypothetical protein